jgi:chromosomal replication initiation ATPase DnaA
MTAQLPLPFAEAPTYAEADFCAAECNAAARSWLQKPQAWSNGRMVLWGAPGCGKTFMLHLWAQSTGAVMYEGAALCGLPPLPGTPIAVDDSDRVPEETALLHLLNAAAEAGHPVLLTAHAPPSRQTHALPDLASRLRASLAVEILAPDDAMLSTLLFRLASARQLILNGQVSQFLLTQLPRTPDALREAVARLDHAALASGGKVTRGLAAQILNEMRKQEVLF